MNMRLLFVAAVAACGGGGGGGGDDSSVDASGSNVPNMIKVSGVASEIGIGGRTPVANVTIEAYRNGAEPAVVASATTDAAGKYTVTIATNGVALDGYLLAKHNPHKNTYLYPPGPLAADTDTATVLLLTTSTFDTAGALAQVSQEPGKGWIGIIVVDAANNPIEGATISSSPAGVVRYNGANGLPSRTATATGADGVGYVFNVAAGTVMVSANKAGSTFHAHDILARADQVTTTVIQ
jgi:hypothetical protein